jgi:hypothetical protein
MPPHFVFLSSRGIPTTHNYDARRGRISTFEESFFSSSKKRPSKTAKFSFFPEYREPFITNTDVKLPFFQMVVSETQRTTRPIRLLEFPAHSPSSLLIFRKGDCVVTSFMVREPHRERDCLIRKFKYLPVRAEPVEGLIRLWDRGFAPSLQYPPLSRVYKSRWRSSSAQSGREL